MLSAGNRLGLLNDCVCVQFRERLDGKEGLPRRHSFGHGQEKRIGDLHRRRFRRQNNIWGEAHNEAFAVRVAIGGPRQFIARLDRQIVRTVLCVALPDLIRVVVQLQVICN